MYRKNNDKLWKFFTGLPVVNKIIHDLIKAFSSLLSTTFNQLLLTIIKLKLNLDFKLITYTFKISQTTTASYFENVICILI